MNSPTLPTPTRNSQDTHSRPATANRPLDHDDDQPPAVERIAATAHAAIDQAAAKAGPALEKVQEKVQDVSQLSNQWLYDTRQQVRRHPLSAVAFGLLAGWLIARTSKRPRLP